MHEEVILDAFVSDAVQRNNNLFDILKNSTEGAWTKMK